MKIYRVEHYYTRKGPYHARWSGRDTLNVAHWSTLNIHPRPPRKLRTGYRWGFVSMQDMFRWFGGWMPVMMRNGFEVRIYDVPEAEVILLDGQAAFSAVIR